MAPPVLPRHAGGREARRRPSRRHQRSRSSASAARVFAEQTTLRPEARLEDPGSRRRQPAADARTRTPRGAAGRPGTAPARAAVHRRRPPRASRRRWAEPDVAETRRPATRSTDRSPPRSPTRRRLARGCAPRRGDRRAAGTPTPRAPRRSAPGWASHRAGASSCSAVVGVGRVVLRPGRPVRTVVPRPQDPAGRRRRAAATADDGVVEPAPDQRRPRSRAEPEPGTRGSRQTVAEAFASAWLDQHREGANDWHAALRAARDTAALPTKLEGVDPAGRAGGPGDRPGRQSCPSGSGLPRGLLPGRLRRPACCAWSSPKGGGWWTASTGSAHDADRGPGRDVRRRRPRRVALLVALTATLALLCCGGGDGGVLPRRSRQRRQRRFRPAPAAAPPVRCRSTASCRRSRAYGDEPDPQRGDHHQRRRASSRCRRAAG